MQNQVAVVERVILRLYQNIFLYLLHLHHTVCKENYKAMLDCDYKQLILFFHGLQHIAADKTFLEYFCSH